jgi:hypothetical protein
MTTTLGLMAISALMVSADTEADFIAKVEQTELIVNGKAAERVERDREGHVIRLRLDRMQLSSDDFEALEHLTTLENLRLWGVNLTDDDLQHLQKLPHLVAMSLTRTDVTDAAVDVLLEFPALRTLCLGDVNVTPEAVARLKDGFEARDRRLLLGYSQRRD